jgi:hypothetical protein
MMAKRPPFLSSSLSLETPRTWWIFWETQTAIEFFEEEI